MSWCSTTMGLDPEYTPRAAGALVMNVAKGGPAALAGLRAGDRIDFNDIAFRERWRLRDAIKGWGGLAGEHLRYVAHRGSNVIVAVVRPRRVAPRWRLTWDDWISVVACFWGLLFAAILASRRPGSVEARLLSIMLFSFFGLNITTGFFAPWPVVEFVIHMLSGSLFSAVPAVCLTILASRAARPLTMTRRVLAVFAIAGAFANAAFGAAWYVGWFALALPVYWAWSEPYSTSVALLASLASVIAAAFAARGAERARLLWIGASVSPIWLYLVLADLVTVINPSLYYQVPPYLAIPLSLAFLSFPVAVTYAVLSRRIVDIGYVLNQAAVFSGVSIVVVGLFMLGEWVLGSWFSRVSHMTNLEISAALALGLGFSVRVIHSRVDHVLDRAFFRKRHEDEAAIRSFAEAASAATDPATLERRTKETLETHAGAAFVTLVMREGTGPFRDVSENDPAIVALQDRHHKALDLHTVSTQLRGEFAYPMIARGQLVGALVLGPKRSGESYAPDEAHAIMQLAREVGAALHNLALAKLLKEHHLPV
jgi:hypothetical protein